MSLAQIMVAHGKALGPLGVAVYAWIEANPGSTFKEVADGLDMGESTVKRCVRQFEELGIAGRQIETTPKGLALPTRIYPGTIERGTSDNPLSVRTPSPQNPVTIELAETIEVILSDPGTIERGTSGTPIAPYSDIRTSTDTPSPTAQEGVADAPPPARKTQKVVKHPSAKPEPVELPDWLSPETWAEWERFNRERRKPIPPTTARAQLKQLAEFRARGMPPEKVIAQSIARNWQGLFEVKEQNGHAKSGPHRNGDSTRKPGLAEHARRTAEHFGLGRKASGTG